MDKEAGDLALSSGLCILVIDKSSGWIKTREFLKLPPNTNYRGLKEFKPRDRFHMHLLFCILAVKLLLYQDITEVCPNNLKYDMPKPFSL